MYHMGSIWFSKVPGASNLACLGILFPYLSPSFCQDAFVPASSIMYHRLLPLTAKENRPVYSGVDRYRCHQGQGQDKNEFHTHYNSP